MGRCAKLSVFVLACTSVVSVVFPSASGIAAEDRLEWQFSEGNDPDNKGRATARLVYGIPETDAVQVSGICDAAPSTSVKFSSITFAADIGSLANGQDVDLRFSGGGFDHAVKGQVRRATGEGEGGGLSGVVVPLEHGDALWTAMTEKDELDYLVPGYKASSLSFARGRDSVKSFIAACRNYAGVLEPAGQGTDAAGGGDAKKSEVVAAFESAKELGTADAWNAFLANYPKGFHADLARAYLKKMSNAAPGSAPGAAVTPAANVAEELSCSEVGSLRSVKSEVPARVTFVNTSGMYRSISWIDGKGGFKDFGGLNSGEQLTIDTFVTHPWMIATGPGDCLQVFRPVAGSSTVELHRLAADDGPSASPAKGSNKPPAKPVEKTQTKPATKTPSCGKNFKLSKGKCVAIQNCGKNAYRSSSGVCRCNKNYEMRGGKCQWKTDKNGFEVAPWKKPGCSSLQAQCNQGNGSACMKYEENCQVN